MGDKGVERAIAVECISMLVTRIHMSRCLELIK